MTDKLDPQVQIKIVDLAWKHAEKTNKVTGKYADKTNLELFDEAYKALIKTVLGT